MLRPLRVLLAMTALGAVLGTLRAENNASIDRIRKDISFLASEECEGRGVETKGINKAADYIAATFKEAGLKPAGKDGSYFQPFTISGPASLGEGNAVTLRGPADQATELAIGKQIAVTGLSGAGKVNADLVFVGHGITDKELKYDDYANVDVAGKWVVILRKTPRPDVKDKGFPEADRFAPLVYKIANAEQHKAAGVIFVNDRKTADDADDLMPFGYTAGGGSSTFPVLHLKRAKFDEILAGSKLPKLTEIEDKIDADLQPQSKELAGWKVSATTAIKRKILDVKNVVGVLEGNGPLADETIIIGGHYDHLGRGEVGSLAKKEDRPLTHFGADDNASGTTGVLELARRFGAIKNRQGRRIVFMGFSGEERGLLGSAHYANKAPLFPLDKTVAMLNLDMIGRLRPDANAMNRDALELGGTGTADIFDKLVDRLNEKYKFQLKKSKGGMGPSDHASFYPKGVPVFFFFTGLHPQYHRPTDIPETINADGLKKIVDFAEEIATELSAVPERPKYLKVAGGLTPGGRPSVPSIRFQPGSYDEAEEKGVLVGGVTKDGPADKGGLKEGDFIVDIGGKPVKNMDGYMAAMSLQKAGTVVEFTVDRKGKKLKLSLTPQ